MASISVKAPSPAIQVHKVHDSAAVEEFELEEVAEVDYLAHASTSAAQKNPFAEAVRSALKEMERLKASLPQLEAKLAEYQAMQVPPEFQAEVAKKIEHYKYEIRETTNYRIPDVQRQLDRALNNSGYYSDLVKVTESPSMRVLMKRVAEEESGPAATKLETKKALRKVGIAAAFGGAAGAGGLVVAAIAGAVVPVVGWVAAGAAFASLIAGERALKPERRIPAEQLPTKGIKLFNAPYPQFKDRPEELLFVGAEGFRTNQLVKVGDRTFRSSSMPFSIGTKSTSPVYKELSQPADLEQVTRTLREQKISIAQLQARIDDLAASESK